MTKQTLQYETIDARTKMNFNRGNALEVYKCSLKNLWFIIICFSDYEYVFIVIIILSTFVYYLCKGKTKRLPTEMEIKKNQMF